MKNNELYAKLLMRVDELGLGPVAVRQLRRAGWETLADIVSLTRQEILGVSSVRGKRKTLNALDLVVENLGLRFGMDISEYKKYKENQTMPVNVQNVREFMDTRMGAQLAALVARRKYDFERDREMAGIESATEFDKNPPSIEEIAASVTKWEDLSSETREAQVDEAREILRRVGDQVDFVALMRDTDEIAGPDMERLTMVAAEALYEREVDKKREAGWEEHEGRIYPPGSTPEEGVGFEEPSGMKLKFGGLDEIEREYYFYAADDSVFKSIGDLHRNPVLDVKDFLSMGDGRYTHEKVGSRAGELDEIIEKGFYEEGLELPVRADFMDCYLEWCGNSVMTVYCTDEELQEIQGPDGGIVDVVNPDPGDAQMSEKFFLASRKVGETVYTPVQDAFSYVLHNGLSASFRGSGLYDSGKEPVFRYSPEGFLESARLGEREVRTTDVVEAYFWKALGELPSMSPQERQRRAGLLKTLEPQVMERSRYFRHSAIVAMSECRRSYEEALRKQRAVQDRNLVPGRDPAEYQRYREGLVRRDKERSEQARGNIVKESAIQERQYTPKNN